MCQMKCIDIANDIRTKELNENEIIRSSVFINSKLVFFPYYLFISFEPLVDYVNTFNYSD